MCAALTVYFLLGEMNNTEGYALPVLCVLSEHSLFQSGTPCCKFQPVRASQNNCAPVTVDHLLWYADNSALPPVMHCQLSVMQCQAGFFL
jgi:hypothetical protein